MVLDHLLPVLANVLDFLFVTWSVCLITVYTRKCRVFSQYFISGECVLRLTAIFAVK